MTYRFVEDEYNRMITEGTPREVAREFLAPYFNDVRRAEVAMLEKSIRSDKNLIWEHMAAIPAGHDFMVIPNAVAGANQRGLRTDCGRWMRSHRYVYEVQWPPVVYFLSSSRQFQWYSFPVLVAEPNALFHFKLRWV